MLNAWEKGYAVMSKDLRVISFEDESLDTCKKYRCRDDVIVERIPKVCGFSMTFRFINDFYKPISRGNVLWIHFYFHKEYLHKVGKVVFDSQKDKEDTK